MVRRDRTLHYFPVAFTVLFVTWVGAYHLFVGTALGFHAHVSSDRYTPTGFLYDPDDNLSYAAWAQQARIGKVLAELPSTDTSNKPLYFNPLFFVLGTASRIFGLPVPALMDVAGLLGAALAIVAIYRAALVAGFGIRAARWSVLILCFASGLSAATNALCRLLSIDPQLWRGADARYPDAFGSSAFVAYPYQSFSLGWTALTVYLVLRAIQKPQRPRWPLVVFSLLILGFVHPYELPALVGSFILSACIDALSAEHDFGNLWKSTFLIVGLLPSFSYNLWLSHQPLWSEFAKISLSLFHPRRFWLVGFVTFLPLLAIGSQECWTDDSYKGVKWLVVWIGLVLFLLLVVNIHQTRIVNGIAIPCTLVAGLGTSMIINSARSIASPSLRRACVLGLLVWGLLSVSSYVGLLKYAFRAEYADTQVLQACNVAIRANRRILLTDVDTSLIASGLTGLTVYAGHPALTPDFGGRLEALKQGGFPVTRIQSNDLSTLSGFQQLIRQTKAQAILIRSDWPAYRFALADQPLVQAGTFGNWHLFFETGSASTQRASEH